MRKSTYLLAALALAFAAALFLSERPWGMTSAPRIAEIATLADDARTASIRRYTEIGSGMLPYLGREAAQVASVRPPIRVGWIYSEFSALRLPFWASSDLGLVTYFDAPGGRQFAMIADGQRPLLDAILGARATQDYRFPWYEHVWGWLFVVGLASWTWLRLREDRAAEEAQWAA